MRIRNTALLAVMALAVAAGLSPAVGRGSHHGGVGGHHHGMVGSGGFGSDDVRGGGAFAGDKRHANDDYVKAAAQEEDKLLDSKIKSICRGC